MMNPEQLATLANSLVKLQSLLHWDLSALTPNQSGTPLPVQLVMFGRQEKVTTALDTKLLEELIAQQIHHHLGILRDAGIDVQPLLQEYHDTAKKLLATEQMPS